MTDSPVEALPLRAAILAQLGGAAVVLLLVVGLGRLTAVDFWQIPFVLALLQGAIAAMISLRQRVPPWWLLIHLAFAPLAVAVQRLDIAPGWFLAAFVLLLLVFWRTDKSRVPLYLSNRATADALLKLLPATPVKVLDLGCGDGGLLARLARARPNCRFIGIEHAPLPWLVARLRSVGLSNLTIRHGDFWQEPLGDYGLIYAFLSPAPMPRLWKKARAELKKGAVLVSNSFAVPDVEAESTVATVAVADRRATRLYLYRLPCGTDKDDDSAAFPAIPRPADQE
ncbi:MAG: methyltransferase type 12 [Rhodocyclaceae bacterium]|nr:methyltransferase type 12 [Rhodocyclaceae bacterium]